MSTRSQIAAVVFAATCATGAWAQGALVDVVEYYHAGLDHYFISSLPGDIGALDSGALKGWSRTGQVFKAYDAPAAGTSPVCRFYLPPASGDSHFYSASPAECAEVAARFPAFSYESPGVMHVGLPDAATGACSAGWAPVYRLWNQRADSNHRYTTDRGLRSQMLAQGYVAEGYGPEGVAMCSPDAGGTLELTFASASMLLMPGDVRDVYAIVTPRNGYSGTVGVTVNGLPAGVSVQVDPPSLLVGSGPAVTTIRLTAAASASPTPESSTITVSVVGTGAETSAMYSVGIAPTGDPIATRLRAMDAVGTRFQALAAQGLRSGDLVQAVADFMAAHPDYEKAGASAKDGTAWGLLRDGVMHVVYANRSPAPVTSADIPMPPDRKNVGDPEVPGATKAHVMHALTQQFEPQTAVTRMRGYLKSRGWSVWQGADGDANVRTLAQVKGDGFFYVNAHGGSARNYLAPPGPVDAWIYTILTSQFADGVPDQAIAASLSTGPRLVYGTAFNGYTIRVAGVDVPLSARYYGITQHFVSDFMQFESDSVVFINVCGSADAGMAAAFHSAGAAVYLGWDGLVTVEGAAFTSAPYFVDRMVGANQHEPKESPPQRPFPYDLVLADMDRKGLKRDSSSGAVLVASRKADSVHPPIFAPSIRYVAVDELDDLLTLTGEFGSRPGKVTVGGVELVVAAADWTPTEIKAQRLPFSGPGSSGDVIVEVNGVRSNARQLTKWTIPLAYQWLDVGFHPGLKIEGEGQVIFRADVGGFRVEPAETPRYKARGGVSNRESRMRVTASGTHIDQGCTYTASGSDVYYSPAYLYNHLAVNYVLQSYFWLDSKSRLTRVGLELGSTDVHTIYTYCAGTRTLVPWISDLDGWMDLPGDQSDDPGTMFLPTIQFAMDSTFTIPAVVRKDNETYYTVQIAWPAVTAESPPRDTPDAGK